MGNKQQIHNADFLMLKQEIKKRFEQLLIDLQSFSTNGFFKQTIQRFRPCIEPNEALGESQLPFYSKKPESHVRNKDFCVLCNLSYTVQLYWKFCEAENSEAGAPVGCWLEELEEYAKLGPKKFKIAGKKYPGYVLERI